MQITTSVVAVGIIITGLLLLLLTFLIVREPYKARWETLKALLFSMFEDD